jgi:putative component of toxin-antitoxin plasmid stabilization module
MSNAEFEGQRHYPWDLPLDLTKEGARFGDGVRCKVIGVVVDGICGAADSLRSLPEKAQSRFLVVIERLIATGQIRDETTFRRIQDKFGDVWEMKAHVGPGYRLFLIHSGPIWFATHARKKPKDSQYVSEAARARDIFGRRTET